VVIGTDYIGQNYKKQTRKIAKIIITVYDISDDAPHDGDSTFSLFTTPLIQLC